MATKRGKQKAPERPILFWVKDVPVHASSDMRPCRKGEPVPRKRRLGFLKSECVRSNDGIDFWLDQRGHRGRGRDEAEGGRQAGATRNCSPRTWTPASSAGFCSCW